MMADIVVLLNPSSEILINNLEERKRSGVTGDYEKFSASDLDILQEEVKRNFDSLPGTVLYQGENGRVIVKRIERS